MIKKTYKSIKVPLNHLITDINTSLDEEECGKVLQTQKELMELIEPSLENQKYPDLEPKSYPGSF